MKSIKSDMLSNKALTVKLKALAAAYNKALKLRDEISAHSIAVFGHDPSDVDNDIFVEACGGFCMSIGMTAKEFNESMVECINAGYRL